MIKFTHAASAAILVACSAGAIAQTAPEAAAPVQTAVPAAPVQAASVVTPSTVAATPAAAPVIAVAKPVIQANGATLPANTEMLFTLNQEVSSKRMKEGETFALTLASDVMLGNFIVIPKGTPATGQITYRTGKGSFGKSAKMEIDLQWLKLPDRTGSISGHYRKEGEGNTGATVGAAVAVGVFSAFVTGRSAVFPQGQELKGWTKDSLSVQLPSN